MRLGYGVAAVRRAESELMARLPDGTLMRRAAAGLAAAAIDVLGRPTYGRQVALLVGAGDNGGDALFAGARLARRGAVVRAVLLDPDRAHPAGLAAMREAGGRAVPAFAPGSGEPPSMTPDASAVLKRAELILDGIVGIGAAGPLRSGPAAVVAFLDTVAGAVIAVDLPSGVDPDTGAVPGTAVRADVTVTFGTYKPGLLVDPGAGHAGVVHLVDIGLDPYLAGTSPAIAAPQGADVAALWPAPRDTNLDKYRRGVVGVLAGSDAYPGAAVLAVGGALHGGAGMVRYVGPDRVAALVHGHWPEAVVATDVGAAGRVQAWVVGPGLGTGAEVQDSLDAVLATDLPVLVDADALTLLARRGLSQRAAPTLLTPHAGEAARLLGGDPDRATVEANRLRSVRELVERYRTAVLLKGTTTLVAGTDSGRPAMVNPTGTPWLATAGSSGRPCSHPLLQVRNELHRVAASDVS